jgi:hypothetical protein
MAPIVHGLEADYNDRINFIYLDIDDSQNDEFKRALGYRFQPHFFLVDGEGKVVQQWVGRISGDSLILAFEEVLLQASP